MHYANMRWPNLWGDEAVDPSSLPQVMFCSLGMKRTRRQLIKLRGETSLDSLWKPGF